MHVPEVSGLQPATCDQRFGQLHAQALYHYAQDHTFVGQYQVVLHGLVVEHLYLQLCIQHVADARLQASHHLHEDCQHLSSLHVADCLPAAVQAHAGCQLLLEPLLNLAKLV